MNPYLSVIKYPFLDVLMCGFVWIVPWSLLLACHVIRNGTIFRIRRR